MNIPSSGAGTVLGTYAQQKAAFKKSKLAPRAQPTAADQVELSAQARGLKRAQEIVAASASVRPHKVAELAQALKQGRYRINPAEIADSILDQVREYRREV
mgnify:CR=1 FL=1